MVIALVIESIILIGAILFGIYSWKIFKKVLSMAITQLTNPEQLSAYDGKYYPATVVMQIKFNQPEEIMITDWSLYEDKKIVGFILQTTDSVKDYLGYDLEMEDTELFEEPIIFPNATVYAISEGVWIWK